MPNAPSRRQGRVTTLGQGKFLRLVRRNGFEFAERANASGVVAVMALAGRRLLLVEQYREAVQAPVIDLPSGLAGDIPGDEAEAYQQAALRELEEETGYTASTCRERVCFPTTPGLTSEIVTLFEAESLKKVAAGGGVDGEAITVHSVLLSKIDRWIEEQTAAGKRIDPKVFVALGLWARDGRYPVRRPAAKR